MERLQVVLSGTDLARAEVKVKIAKERLEEFAALDIRNDLTNLGQAAAEADGAIDGVENELGKLEIKFKAKGTTITSDQLQQLLAQLQTLLSAQAGLIRKIEIKIKDDEIKIKVKTFLNEATESADLVDDDIDDLEDDDELNASIFKVLELEVEGILQKVGSVFQITAGGRTHILASPTINLDEFVGKLVEIEGTAPNSTPTQVTVTKIELEDEEVDEEEELEAKLKVEINVPATANKVEAKGFLRRAGTGFVLKDDGKVLFTLSSNKINLSLFVDKFVEAEGFVTGATINVVEIEVKATDAANNPISPALPTSERHEGDDEDNKDGGSDNSGSSGSSGSGSSSGGGEDRSGSNSGED